MNDTKERILITALHLFARDGYEAVSVSDIAQALGMTKGALYKHYRNKRDIFDSMLKRMLELDSSAARQYGMPEQNLNENDSGYDQVDWSELRQFSLAQFRFWTEDAFACPMRRMLSLEQFRSEEMGKLYQEMAVSGPVHYTADVFRRMMERGRMKPGDADALAAQFYAPMFLLIAMADGGAENGLSVLQGLIDDFIGRWRI